MNALVLEVYRLSSVSGTNEPTDHRGSRLPKPFGLVSAGVAELPWTLITVPPFVLA